MGLFSSIGDVVQGVIDFNNPKKWIDSFSGQSQQADANQMAMTSWNMMNNYNHPIEQMKRLISAGLNPLLVYTSGSVTGNTTSAPALHGGGVSTPLETIFKIGGKALSALQGMATLDQTYASTAAQQAAAGASGAQAANLNAQAALNTVRSKYEQKSMIADIDYKQALAAKTRAEADLAQGEADIFGSVGGSKGAQTLGKGAKEAAKFGPGLIKAGRYLRGIFK